jgi:phosphohistidine phosphatase SixA
MQMKSVVSALALSVALLGPMTGAPAAASELTGEAMLTALKTGGYIVYFRHAISDTTQNDADPIKIEDCATQRNLSDAGRAQAKKIGGTFQAFGIGVDKALASPYCRTSETAKLAFEKAEQSAASALYYSLALPKEGAAKAADELKKLLATAPKSGSNTVMVGHTSNLKEVAGVWPKKEGGAYVFQPDGSGGFKLIGSLDPADFDKKPSS